MLSSRLPWQPDLFSSQTKTFVSEITGRIRAWKQADSCSEDLPLAIQIGQCLLLVGFNGNPGRKRAMEMGRCTDVSLASCLCLQLEVDRKPPTCAAICRLRRVAPGHLRLALPDPSIGRRSCMQSDIGKASVELEESSWAGHDWKRQGLFREDLREVEGHWVWALGTKRKFHSARWCNSCASNRQPPKRGGGSSPWATEKSTNTPGSADSLLRHVEITGDFDFLKITTTETTFLPVKSTAESQHARTLNERN